jgi:putative endonuclease
VAKTYYVYILSGGRYGTIYTGVTSDLVKRAWQHQEGFADGFTKKYNVKQLVWYEVHDDVQAASPAKSKSKNGTARGRSN